MLFHYAVALCVTATTHFILAIIIYARGPRRLTNITYALYSIAISWWSGFEAVGITRTDATTALFWWRFNHVGVIFITIFFVHFVISLLEPQQRDKRKPVIRGAYGFGLIALALDATPFLIREVVPKFSFRHFINPGPAYGVFFSLWILLAIYGLVELFRLYASSTGAKRNQLTYFYWSMFIAYLGGVPNFFPTFNIEIPYLMPFGTYAIPLYALATAYAIVRYRLMDVTIAITRTSILLAVYGVVVGVPIVLGAIWKPALLRLFGSHWWMGPMGLYTIAAFVGPFIYLYFQRQAESRLLQEQRRYQTTLLQASQGMIQIRDLKQLLSLIVHVVTRTVGLTHAAVFLVDLKAQVFVQRACRYTRPGTALIEMTDPLIAVLQQTRQPLVQAELQAEAGEATTNGLAQAKALASSALSRLKASVVIPSFREDELIGFLLLGEKTSGRAYSQDDLNVLQTLANQAALAIQNAQFYSELQTKTAELIHESRLKSMGKMASGLSHQIHNRLMVLGGEAMLFTEMYLPRLRAAAGVEREQLMDKLAMTLTSIAQESVKGKEIVKKLLDFSKPATNTTRVSLKVVVEGGLRMVSLNHQAQLERCQVQLAIPEQPKLEVNLTQIEDVFFNLFDNALDAIKSKAALLDSGKLTLPPEQLPCQGTLAVTAHPTEDRTRLLIRVADNGLGMSPEDQECLFLPFFTTKGTAEKGTGMGVFIIREILRAHGGDIRLEHAVYGQGTTFLLELPIPEGERG